MGMRDEIQQELGAAFDAEDELADAVDSFTCTRKKLVSSNPATGEDTYIEYVYSGRGVLFGSWAKDLVKPIDYRATDSKAVLLQNEVKDAAGTLVDPDVNDIWVIEGGNYRVVSYGKDAADATWVAQLRKV
ncbi:glutamate 5-kinase [Acinetobacter baumannii]|uniref:glutamate 5-kinase n=1 Tax=Acinetobacter baumannii TaxID=470 RepID=UPI0011281F98|nr:glutamate 5-kinase [Acinetobacter baumannii]EHU2204850.1 glutamate 5-kinase [Acinetobacter baumannii]EHU2218871.1 glutamate 5-kinase [Acinetobacter baumannii]EHU2393217.1 glutamate 5-kinase [Acinetobacter baumannii]EHU2599644.1 glutamate 5-kinase [Acinetobacter baumannii]EHU2789189.1 glutamate 5-kinase [Acinetobacter baumannii]